MKKLMMLFITAIFCVAMINVAYAADNATEFGVEDDLWIGGNQGTAPDPDVEIKGFSVFGATQTSYSPGIPIGPGNVIINGYLGVSSGAYFVGGSTFSANQGAYFLGISSFSDVSKMYVSGGSANQALLYDGSDGSLKWGDVSSLVSGDNLGNHIATTTLNMNSWGINNVSTITFLSNVYISSANAINYGGIYISTNVYTPGDIHANKFYGDGSGLTGVSASISGTPNRIQKIDSDGSGLVDAGIVQSGNTDAASITVVSSSFTVNNAALFKGNTTLGDGDDTVTVNGSGASGTKFVVFQSNGSNVAWMRKK